MTLPEETLAVLPDMPIKQQEFSRISSNGGEYITKIVFEDAYWTITYWFNEMGQIVKRSENNKD